MKEMINYIEFNAEKWLGQETNLPKNEQISIYKVKETKNQTQTNKMQNKEKKTKQRDKQRNKKQRS